MARPILYPEWAKTLIVDPSSGQKNIVEPTAARKNTGWIFKEFPPRQFFNWLSNLIYLWVAYFDQQIVEIDSEFDDFSSELVVGFSSFTTKKLLFKILPNDLGLIAYDLQGPSNATDLYFNLPTSIPSAFESVTVISLSQIKDNGVDGVGTCRLPGRAARRVNVFPNTTLGSLWSGTGTKKASGSFTYRRG